MSAAFWSGVVPSRVIWIVTIGMVVSSVVADTQVLPMAGVGTAIDVQGLAGHERGRLQIQYRFNDFLDLAHSPQRVQPGEEVMRLGRVHRRLDNARRYGVDADA